VGITLGKGPWPYPSTDYPTSKREQAGGINAIDAIKIARDLRKLVNIPLTCGQKPEKEEWLVQLKGVLWGS